MYVVYTSIVFRVRPRCAKGHYCCCTRAAHSLVVCADGQCRHEGARRGANAIYSCVGKAGRVQQYAAPSSCEGSITLSRSPLHCIVSAVDLIRQRGDARILCPECSTVYSYPITRDVQTIWYDSGRKIGSWCGNDESL